MNDDMGAPAADVSIVITKHNCGAFVGKAIQSALAQTHPTHEVFIVVDVPTDDSEQIIESLGLPASSLPVQQGSNVPGSAFHTPPR